MAILTHRKCLRPRVLVLQFQFLVTALVYFGITLGAVSLDVNPYIFMVISGIIELAAHLFTTPVAVFWGRRIPCVISYFICGVTVLVLPFLPAGKCLIPYLESIDHGKGYYFSK